jgi:hypothetical protein
VFLVIFWNCLHRKQELIHGEILEFRRIRTGFTPVRSTSCYNTSPYKFNSCCKEVLHQNKYVIFSLFILFIYDLFNDIGPTLERRVPLSGQYRRKVRWKSIDFSEECCRLLLAGLVYSSTFTMEAVCSFETSVNVYRTLSLPVPPTFEHRASVNRFVSLQFLNPTTVGRTPWMGGSVRRNAATYTNTE